MRTGAIRNQIIGFFFLFYYYYFASFWKSLYFFFTFEVRARARTERPSPRCALDYHFRHPAVTVMFIRKYVRISKKDMRETGDSTCRQGLSSLVIPQVLLFCLFTSCPAYGMKAPLGSFSKLFCHQTNGQRKKQATEKREKIRGAIIAERTFYGAAAWLVYAVYKTAFLAGRPAANTYVCVCFSDAVFSWYIINEEGHWGRWC